MDISDINYRVLTVDDTLQLSVLGKECLPEFVYDISHWQRLANSSNNIYYTFGAFLGDKLIGAVASIRDAKKTLDSHLTIEEHEAFKSCIEKEVSYIAAVIVHEKLRRKGIATKLLNEVIQHLESNNTGLIYLHAEVDNSDATTLYEKLGFTQKCQLKKYFKKKQTDALLFIKSVI